jgi:hypothetical protein
MSIFFVCLWSAMLSLISAAAAVGTSVAGGTCALLEAPLWKGRTEAGYRITAPQYAISGLLVAVQVERRGAGVEGIEECQLCYTVGTGSDASPQTCLPVKLYRGKGSASLRLNSRGDRGTAWVNLIQRPHDHQDPGAGPGILLAQTTTFVLPRQDEDAHCDEVHSGILLTDESLVWQPHAIICVLSNITVPAGKVLQVFGGTTVLISRGADVIVHGALHVMGTVESPVIWMPMHLEPWGGIQLTWGTDEAEQAENRNLFMHSWFVGGGDSLYYRSEENSQSQPVVLIESSKLTMVGGGILDSPGRKAFYASNSSIFAHCIQVWRCDTVGEFEGSHLHLEGGIMTEFPEGKPLYSDDISDDARTAVCITGEKRTLGLLYPYEIREDATCGNFRNKSRSDLIMCRDVIDTGEVGYINTTMGDTASSIHNHVYPTLAKTGFDVFLYTHSDDGETLDPAWEFLRPAGSSEHTGARRNAMFHQVDEPEYMLDYNTETMGKFFYRHTPRRIQELLWQVNMNTRTTHWQQSLLTFQVEATCFWVNVFEYRGFGCMPASRA